ncbi:MAG: hypothetical protein WC911_03500 [Thermoleophilia bacterium]
MQWALMYGKLFGGGQAPLQLDDDDNLKTTLGLLVGGRAGTPLPHDSVDVVQKTKGEVTTVHNAITAPALSSAVDCTGYNGLLIDFNVSAYTSGSVVLKVKAAIDATGTYGDLYMYVATCVQNTIALGAASRIIIPFFHGLPDSIKIDISGTFVATATVKVQPYIV